MPRIPHFRYFTSFSFVLLALFMNKPNSSRNLTIFIKSSIALFEITNAVVTKSRIVSWISGSSADFAAANLNYFKILPPNDLSTFSLTVNHISLMIQEVY